MPLAGVVFNMLMFLRLASKPSVGETKPGEAFSEERLERDWIEISAIKYGNMAITFSAPVVVKVIALSFICRPFDNGEDEELLVMASDLTVDLSLIHI